MKYNKNQNKKGYRMLGMDHPISNDDIKSGYNNNDLIIGGSGTGKTGGYVIPNIRLGYGNMIITDTKSQLIRLLKPELQEQGYDVSVLDFVNPDQSEAYNPLDYVRKNEHNGREEYNNKDIISLSKSLLPNRIQDDPFWEESARTVLSFLIAFTLEAFQDEDHHIGTVVELYRQLVEEKHTEKFETWCMLHPHSFATRKFRMFSGVMSVDKTWGCICQFLAEALDPFDYREMDMIFGKLGQSRKQLRLSELWETKKVVFLNISDTDRYADQVANLFYTQAFQNLCLAADQMENGRLPIPVRFMLDDFASNVYIENFEKLVSVIRSRNISISIILQSLAQLQTMYSKEQANTIITNCDHLLYLGGQDIETAKYIAYRANKYEENILLMPTGKAYLIERGKQGILVDCIVPYENMKDGETYQKVDKKQPEDVREEKICS